MPGDARAEAVAVVAEFIATECGYAEPTDLMVGQAADLLDTIPAGVLARLAIDRGGMKRLGESLWVEVATGEAYLVVTDTRRGDADAIGSLPNDVPVYRITEESQSDG